MIITDAADNWFRTNLGLENGGGVKFYGKTYGSTEVHHGFSQGFTREDVPVSPILETLIIILITLMNGFSRD